MVPVTVVTGFLGVGKTTAILDLFSHRPADGRWAVLVNEFGEVGIDGAVLAGGGLTVEEVPGGCICCSAGLALRVALVRLLREVRPDRLLIEPTGLAHPASVIDTLRTPGLREALQVRAVIGLVDPRHCRSDRHLRSPIWQDQVRIADVLVANKTDLCTPDDVAAFHRVADTSWPPKLAVAETTHGRLDPAWLELGPAEGVRVLSGLHTHDEAASRGWVWPAEAAFDRDRLQDVLQALVRPDGPLPRGVLRLKGVFRTRGAWLHVDADPDRITFSPVGHRRDSRVELIVPVPEPAWSEVEAAFEGARIR